MQVARREVDAALRSLKSCAADAKHKFTMMSRGLNVAGDVNTTVSVDVSNMCAVCGTTAQLSACSRCSTVYYCSEAHQRLHWKAGHKHRCTPTASKASLGAAAKGAGKKAKKAKKRQRRKKTTNSRPSGVYPATVGTKGEFWPPADG